MPLLGQQLRIRPISDPAWGLDPDALEPLEPVLEHGAILLVEEVATHAHAAGVGFDAEVVEVERRVVDTTQAQTVADDWLARRVCVRDDVGCIKETGMTQAAHGALLSVSLEDSRKAR